MIDITSREESGITVVENSFPACCQATLIIPGDTKMFHDLDLVGPQVADPKRGYRRQQAHLNLPARASSPGVGDGYLIIPGISRLKVQEPQAGIGGPGNLESLKAPLVGQGSRAQRIRFQLHVHARQGNLIPRDRQHDRRPSSVARTPGVP